MWFCLTNDIYCVLDFNSMRSTFSLPLFIDCISTAGVLKPSVKMFK